MAGADVTVVEPSGEHPGGSRICLDAACGGRRVVAGGGLWRGDLQRTTQRSVNDGQAMALCGVTGGERQQWTVYALCAANP